MMARSIIYLLSNIINALIPLVLLPVLTRVLTVEEYGQVGLFQTLITAFAGLVGFSAASAAGRKYFDEDVTEEEMQRYIGAAVQVLVASLVPLALLIYFLAKPISGWLALPASWVVVAAAVPALNVLIQLRLVQWQVRGAAYRYGALQITYSAINLALSLILILALGLGGEGRVTAQFTAAGLAAAAAILLLRKDRLIKVFSWNPEFLKQIAAYGLPLVPHVVGLFLLTYADRFVIGTELGLGSAGMYIAAVQLVGGAAIIFDAVNKAYVPWLFERLARDDPREKRQIVVYTYIWFGCIAAGVILAFVIGPSVYVFIAGRAYIQAAPVIGWIALAQGLHGMYLMVTNYIFYSRRTGILAVTTMVSAVIGLVALVLLVRPFGLVGAALASCIGMLVRFVLTWGAAQVRHPMPWLGAFRSPKLEARQP